MTLAANITSRYDDEDLEALDEACERGANAMPYIVDAVKADATLGEIMGVFEERYGAYSEEIGLA
ncbi:methylmalonyl-CoA mutase large subunit [Natrinema pellirubrum DSM 15624]|uniref:Methylmalonyl-CoA mutase large subunit n=1 Tax=Natrinema pellirubrum (strain DSM 15624 / CIP 106293 / JCM 10476 / NCIMB 786 / 157) TaxID=797303 RepID=L9YNG4_NATP1|nr:methylmalonyl-CoA mutase large subunit [Natrinema pellirubrum DSM 15624]